MAGYIFILAIILLGGTIATIGDRLGTKVGKARLSLFNLRPRNTAVLITILTGSVISASTLGILFATNQELRDAVFRIETIQKQRRAAEKAKDQVETELRDVQIQRDKIEAELATARADLSQVRQQLDRVNQTLSQAIARQKLTQTQLNQLQTRYVEAQNNLQQYSRQAEVLRTEIQRLMAEEQQLRRDREALLAQRQQILTQRDQVQARLQQAETENQRIETQKQKLETSVAQAQKRLQQAEKAVAQAQQRLQQVDAQRLALLNQQSGLRNEIADLEENRKRLERNMEVLLLGLRRGNITIRTGQVLASGVVQGIGNRQDALQATEALLREARRTAILLTNPRKLNPNHRVIQITNEDVEQLVQQIGNGQAYVIRILAAANYLEGEESVLVVPQVAPNQVIFGDGELVASVSLNPALMTDEQILERLDHLFVISNQRAIQSGLLPDPLTGTVGSFRQIDLIKFVLELKAYDGDVSVTAIAPQAIYTSGPLKLELIATQNQKVILKSS